MSYKEEILAVLNGKKISKMSFAPEMLRWYKWHKNAGTLPSKYRDAKMVDICEDLNIGMLPLFNCGKWQEDVKITRKDIGNVRQTDIETPLGKVNMEEEVRREYESSYWPTKKFIKKVEDIKVIKYYCERLTVEIEMPGQDGDYGDFSNFEKEVGGRGLIRVNLPRIPLMRYLIDYVQYEDGILFLHDYPQQVEELFSVIEKSDDSIYKTAGDFPAPIFNFGDNMNRLISPKLFSKYCVPYYRKRTAELHDRKKICFCHMDGDIKDLILLIPETGIDCIDGMPLFPMTRVRPIDVKEVVSQGISVNALLPASLFVPSGSLDLLKEEVLELKEIYNQYGRIILGVSDEFPPDGVLDRIRYVQDLLK